MPWREIGAGSYNRVYINDSDEQYKHFVFKVLKNPKDSTDLPERSVQLWNEINPDLHAFNPDLQEARVHNDPQLGKGWLAPFIQGVQANDQEISRTLIHIYERTGRIIIDALSPNNFIRTHGNEVICIDVGMALRLEPLHQKDASPTSVFTWLSMHHDYNDYFLRGQRDFPFTVATTKALLYIELNPNLYKDTASDTLRRLRQLPILIHHLARAYDDQHQQQGSLQLRHLVTTQHSNTQELAKIPKPLPAPKAPIPGYPQAQLGFFAQRQQRPPQPHGYPGGSFHFINPPFAPRLNPFPVMNGAVFPRTSTQFAPTAFFLNPADSVALARAQFR